MRKTVNITPVILIKNFRRGDYKKSLKVWDMLLEKGMFVNTDFGLMYRLGASAAFMLAFAETDQKKSASLLKRARSDVEKAIHFEAYRRPFCEKSYCQAIALRARIIFAKNDDYSKNLAIGLLKRAMAIYPKSCDMRNNFIALLICQSQIARAEKYAFGAVKLAENQGDRFALAQAHWLLGLCFEGNANHLFQRTCFRRALAIWSKISRNKVAAGWASEARFAILRCEKSS